MMTMSRRAFALGAVSTAATFTSRLASAAPGADDADFVKLVAGFGWDAAAPGAFSFAHVTDTHVCEAVPRLTLPHKFEGKSFVDDLNALAPKPAFVALTGDLVSGADLDEKNRPDGAAHFAVYKRLITDRLARPFHQILGNNDCSTKAYHAVFPDRPTDWCFERDGVAFAGLHGYNLWKVETTNHAGCLYDAAQLARLDAFVSKTDARTLVLFTHEALPDGDQHLARPQLDPIVAKFRGEAVWNIAGHSHYDNDRVFTLGGRPVRCLETRTPIGSWGPDIGAYRLLFVADGRITGSVLRLVRATGEPVGWAASPRWENPAPVERLEHVLPRGALAAYLVGSPAERTAFRSAKGAQYRLTNFQTYGRGFVEWELPSFVLGRPVRTVSVSGSWYGASNFGEAVTEGTCRFFRIPEQKTPTFRFVIENRPEGGLFVLGLALHGM